MKKLGEVGEKIKVKNFNNDQWTHVEVVEVRPRPRSYKVRMSRTDQENRKHLVSRNYRDSPEPKDQIMPNQEEDQIRQDDVEDPIDLNNLIEDEPQTVTPATMPVLETNQSPVRTPPQNLTDATNTDNTVANRRTRYGGLVKAPVKLTL